MGFRKLGDTAYLYPGSPSTLIRVHEGKAVLVDPGHGSGRHKDLKREVRKLGLGVKLQLATHGHADHVSVCPKIDAPLLTHRFEFSIAKSPPQQGDSDIWLKGSGRFLGLLHSRRGKSSWSF